MYALGFRQMILYGVFGKATHRHTNQLRVCTFFPVLVGIGPPPPQEARGGPNPPLRGAPPLPGPAWVGASRRSQSSFRVPPPPPGHPPAYLAARRACAPAAGAARESGLWRGERYRAGAQGGLDGALRAVEAGRRYPKAGRRYPKAGRRYPKAAQLPRCRPRRASPGRPPPPTGSRGPPLRYAHPTPTLRARNGRTPRFGPRRRTTAKRMEVFWCRFPPNPDPSVHLGVHRPGGPQVPRATPRAYCPRPGGPGAPHGGPGAGLPGEIGPRATLPGSRATLPESRPSALALLAHSTPVCNGGMPCTWLGHGSFSAWVGSHPPPTARISRSLQPPVPYPSGLVRACNPHPAGPLLSACYQRSPTVSPRPKRCRPTRCGS